MTDSILRSYQYSTQKVVVPFTTIFNLLSKSQAMDDTGAWSVFNVTVTADALTAPDSTATAEKVTTTALGHSLSRAAFTTVVSGQTYTSSFYFKAVTTMQWLTITAGDSGGNSCRVWYDVLNGVVGSTSTSGTGWSLISTGVSSAGSGWYRCVLSYVVAGSNLQHNISTRDADGSTTGSAIGSEFGIWGAQAQLGSSATAYQANL